MGVLMMSNKKRLGDLESIIRSLNAMASEYDAVSLHGIINSLKEWPTVDAVEVVHGQWHEHYGITLCSNCGAMFDTNLRMLQVPSTWEMPKFCPNCGAKMDGDMNE